MMGRERGLAGCAALQQQRKPSTAAQGAVAAPAHPLPSWDIQPSLPHHLSPSPITPPACPPPACPPPACPPPCLCPPPACPLPARPLPARPPAYAPCPPELQRQAGTGGRTAAAQRRQPLDAVHLDVQLVLVQLGVDLEAWEGGGSLQIPAAKLTLTKLN